MRSLAMLVLLLGACGERVAFYPTANVLAKGRGGEPAASYQIRSAGNQPAATVDVWSRGAQEAQDGTVIDLTLAIRNTGETPIVLDDTALRLEVFGNDGAKLPEGSLVEMSVARDEELAPRAARDIQLRFMLPAVVAPKSIGGLRLHWAVRHDAGQRHAEITEFERNAGTLSATSRGANDGASRQ